MTLPLDSVGEIHPTRSSSPEVDKVAADPEETDSDEDDEEGFDEELEEEGGFNLNFKLNEDSEVTQDSDLERRDEDVDDTVHVEREKIGEECKMPDILGDDLGSVRNSEDSGLEHVPITQKELSIIDSVSLND